MLKRYIMIMCMWFVLVPAHADTPPAGEREWAIMAGTHLKATLEAWSREAGWTLIWDSTTDYRFRASAAFSGSFEVAAADLIDALYRFHPEIRATFHLGNRVLHVEEEM